MTEAIPVYRAVLLAELQDLERCGRFRNPYGNEVKYFALSREGAVRYAALSASMFAEGPYWLVTAVLPDRFVGWRLQASVDQGIAMSCSSDRLTDGIESAGVSRTIMKALPDIVATIELAPSGSGGRAAPMPARWFGIVMVVNGRNHDVRLRLTQPLGVGEARRIGIDFLDPGTALSHVRVGTTFGLWEGGIVGQGAVESVAVEPVLSQ